MVINSKVYILLICMYVYLVRLFVMGFSRLCTFVSFLFTGVDMKLQFYEAH